ncbi:MAG: SgcJ/EcaC family oxidoreductase [Vicinamibacterales bacterium]
MRPSVHAVRAGAAVLLDEGLSAWAARDATKLASRYEADADLTGPDGTHVSGHDAIRDHYEAMLRGPLGDMRPTAPAVEHVRPLSDDLFLVDAAWTATAPDGASRRVQVTYVLLYEGARWSVVSARYMLPWAGK